jgi:hypothetical protein
MGDCMYTPTPSQQLQSEQHSVLLGLQGWVISSKLISVNREEQLKELPPDLILLVPKATFTLDSISSLFNVHCTNQIAQDCII